MIHNIVSISGGKDSTATALLALERETENLAFVFADTGHESQTTYDYVDYLESVIFKMSGHKIRRVRANFDQELADKRKMIASKWVADGVAPDKIEKALAVCQPTGNPFLDLCMYKGRFPSTMARFCSLELKRKPIQSQVIDPIIEDPNTQALISWIGLRADESAARANRQLREVEFGSWDPEPSGLLLYHPIIDWNVDQVFKLHKKHGVKHNPLYSQGMSRVGCFPCIHATKDELRQLAIRFPEAFDKLKDWESIVSAAGKRAAGSTFFAAGKVPGDKIRSKIEDVKLWALTSRGGRQLDLVRSIDETQQGSVCASVYGLCE